VSARDRLRHALFEALYHQLAPRYDQIATLAFAGEWRRWQAIALNYADRAPILELGCGTGHTLAALRDRRLPAYGIDLSGPMLARARQRASGQLMQARAQHLPVASASIGTLLSIFPTAYILEPGVWAEARRVLAPGGRFIIAAHGWLAPRDPLRAGLDRLHRLVYGRAPAQPALLPDNLLPTLALTERSPHGFVALYIATQPRAAAQPAVSREQRTAENWSPPRGKA
jgi:SAM-dependent methyltransferase